MPGCEHGRALNWGTGDAPFTWQPEPSCQVGEGGTDRNEIATFADTRHHRIGRVSRLEAFIAKTKGNLRAFETYASTHDPRREKVEREIEELEAGLERLKAWDEAVLRERARSDKHTARVLLPDPLTGGEETRLLYIRDVGLIVAGPRLTTRPNAIETPTQRKRRKDRMKGKLEPLVRFGMFEVFSEQEWQAAKKV